MAEIMSPLGLHILSGLQSEIIQHTGSLLQTLRCRSKMELVTHGCNTSTILCIADAGALLPIVKQSPPLAFVGSEWCYNHSML